MTPDACRNVGHLSYISSSLKHSNYFWSDNTGGSFYNSAVYGTNNTCSDPGNARMAVLLVETVGRSWQFRHDYKAMDISREGME